MTPLHATTSDEQILAFLDQWAALLEQEDYEAACTFTEQHSKQNGWTPNQIRDAIKLHGQRVTLAGVPSGGDMTREVTRWPVKPNGVCGDVWYDLYIDGQDTDMTALFELRSSGSGFTVHLIDIGVR